MKSKRPALITIWECSARIALDCEYPTWQWMQRQVTLDEAHALIEAPYVVVNADRFRCPNWATGRNTIETGWSVYALGFTEDDAMHAVDRAAEALRSDIAAGNVKKGSHHQWIPRNPLEPAQERELRAYREQTLRNLEMEALANADR